MQIGATIFLFFSFFGHWPKQLWTEQKLAATTRGVSSALHSCNLLDLSVVNSIQFNLLNGIDICRHLGAFKHSHFTVIKTLVSETIVLIRGHQHGVQVAHKDLMRPTGLF